MKVEVFYLGGLRTESLHPSGAKLETDASKNQQGKELSFSPIDFLSAGLGSCMLTLMAMKSKSLGIDLKGMKGEVSVEMGGHPRRIVKLIVRIESGNSPDPSVREALEEAALNCPVRQSLHPEIRVETDFIWGV